MLRGVSTIVCVAALCMSTFGSVGSSSDRDTPGDAIERALQRAREIRATGSAQDAADALVEDARAIIERLGEGDDAADALTRAVEEAQSIPDPSIRLGRLNVGFIEARAATTFEPIMQADLPEGFPPPGPVGKVVVKEYPAYRAARTPMSGGQNTAFNRLFRHITSNSVAMTAPVEMEYDDANSRAVSMAFLYERPTQGSAGSAGGGVEVIDLPPVTVVSIGLRGNDSRQRIDAAVRQLEQWLQSNADRYERAGPMRFMGYNSPFILPYVRFSEVQIPIRPRE